MNEYIHFKLIETKAKTKVYAVISKKRKAKIGEIKWYNPWRQYCFEPNGDTVWNTDCLRDIADFIHALMVIHRSET